MSQGKTGEYTPLAVHLADGCYIYILQMFLIYILQIYKHLADVFLLYLL